MTSVKIAKLRGGAVIPQKKTEGAAAYDVCACLNQPVKIEPTKRVRVPTGLSFEIPSGYFISVRPRSGLALQHGIMLPNAPGTIDSDYRGELMILMINLGNKTYLIQHGDSIAQLLLEPIHEISFEEYNAMDFSKSERGFGGFGSTGQ